MAAGHQAIRTYLTSLPAATLSVQWGDDHVFKVGGKMFAWMRGPDAAEQIVSFKAGDDSFAILTEIEGIIPAPYLARAKWVRLDRLSRLPAAELKAYLARAHGIVAAGLTRKARSELGLI
jgi:predicted DNA-binding protein (MmcQ/YjbR family)